MNFKCFATSVAFTMTFFLVSQPLIAQEKFLKLNRIIKYDNSIIFNPTCIQFTCTSNKIYFTVPQGRYWKIQSMHFRTYNGAGNVLIETNNVQIAVESAGSGSVFGPLWCMPGDVIALSAVGTPNYSNTFNYRIAIFEFLLE